MPYDVLAWTQEWYVREETLRAANTVIVNHHHQLDLAGVFGGGTMSSSDGQRFPVRGKSLTARAMNIHFADQGLSSYTHVSDQHSTYGTKVLVPTAREAHYVLDDLLGNATDLPIREHATDTHGVTLVNFALFDLVGKALTPRIRDLGKITLCRDDTSRAVVARYPHAGRFGRQLPRPHHGDQPTPSQPQPTVLDAESVAGVFQTRQSFLRVLETAPTLTRERAKRLLLRGHRAVGQPRQRATGRSQVLAADMRAAILARRHALIPNPPGPIPLAHQRALGLRSRAQPVVETQHRRCRHLANVTERSDNSKRRHTRQATANGHPHLPIAKARGISGGLR